MKGYGIVGFNSYGSTYNLCYYCTDRYVGCHSKCEKYIDYRNKLDEENKKIREIKYKESIAYSTKIRKW